MSQKIVYGHGPKNAKIFLLGEAPGAEEIKQGVPFVGRAGKFLNKILEEVGIDKKKIYITNVVKHRPPNNRTPTKKEIQKWRQHLEKEISKIKPKIICTLGNTALRFFDENLAVSKTRGRIITRRMQIPFAKQTASGLPSNNITRSKASSYIKVKILPTFHPSAAMHNRKMAKQFKNDLKKLKRLAKKLDYKKLDKREKNIKDGNFVRLEELEIKEK